VAAPNIDIWYSQSAHSNFKARYRIVLLALFAWFSGSISLSAFSSIVQTANKFAATKYPIKTRFEVAFLAVYESLSGDR